ncbi:hypothetical protein D3C75_829070 [compost metagenome]
MVHQQITGAETLQGVRKQLGIAEHSACGGDQGGKQADGHLSADHSGYQADHNKGGPDLEQNQAGQIVPLCAEGGIQPGAQHPPGQVPPLPHNIIRRAEQLQLEQRRLAGHQIAQIAHPPLIRGLAVEHGVHHIRRLEIQPYHRDQ